MSTKKLLQELKRTGPNKVVYGSLDFIGLDGMVVAPETGNGIPLVIFAHDWRTPISRYEGLFEHLASWGIAVAAPNAENGFLASDVELAQRLLEVEGVVSNTRLGVGDVSVQKHLLGFLGHGFGAGATVIAARADQVSRRLRSLVLAWPKPTGEKVYESAQHFSSRSLIIATPDEYDSSSSNVKKISAALGALSVVQTIKESVPTDITKTGYLQRKIFGIKPKRARTQLAYALITGYFLASFHEKSKYKALLQPNVGWKNVTHVSLESLTKEPEEKSVNKKLLAKILAKRG